MKKTLYLAKDKAFFLDGFGYGGIFIGRLGKKKLDKKLESAFFPILEQQNSKEPFKKAGYDSLYIIKREFIRKMSNKEITNILVDLI